MSNGTDIGAAGTNSSSTTNDQMLADLNARAAQQFSDQAEFQAARDLITQQKDTQDAVRTTTDEFNKSRSEAIRSIQSR